MRRPLALFLAGTALLALMGDLALYRMAKHFYTREAMVRLEPVGTPAFTETGPANLPPTLLLGDSRIAQFTTLAPDRVHACNAGVGGETTAQIRLRAQENMDRVKPAVVVIEAGINDLKAIPLMPERQMQIEENCITNLMALVQMGRERGAAVVLCSVWPAGKVGWSRKPVWSAAVAKSLENVNARLEEECRDLPHVTFLNINPEVQIERDYVDTLHFNREFYERISPRLSRAIDEATK